MKRFLRSVCIILAIVMIMTSPAYAAESESARSSSYFGGYSAYLWKTSDTTFDVWFDVSAVDTMDELGVSLIKVQKSSDGENWTTMITYYKENNPQLICKNTIAHGASVSYIGTPGYYYRAYLVLYAKKGSGTAAMPVYTASIVL